MSFLAKEGSFTQPGSTGNQSITGLPFQPKVVIFFGTNLTADGSGAGAIRCIGMAISNTSRRCGTYRTTHGTTAQTVVTAIDDTRCLKFLNADSTPSVNAAADFVSMNSDGFTINWVTTSATARIINYIALGGAALSNVALVTRQLGTSSATAYTGVGFQPDCVMFFASMTTDTAPPTALGTFGGAVGLDMFGWAISSTARGATEARRTNPASTNDASYQRTAKCIAFSTAGFLIDADLVSMDADGFTLNCNNSVGKLAYFFALALKGGRYATGTFNQRTSNGTQSITGLGLQPAAVIVQSFNKVAATTEQAHSRISFGAASDASSRGCIWNGSQSSAFTSNESTNLDRTKVIKMMTENGAAPTTQAAADYSGATSDGFDLNWTTTDATAREIIYLAFGLKPTLLLTLAATAGNVVSSIRKALRNLLGTSGSSPSMIRQVSRAQSTQGTGAATQVRRVNRNLSASATGAAAIVRVIARVFVTVITGTAGLFRTQFFTLSASVTGTGTLSRMVARLLKANTSGTATMAALKTFIVVLSASVTGTATINRLITRMMMAAAANAATLKRDVWRIVQTATETILSRDTFTDTDNTLLSAHTPETGPSWSGGDSNYKIIGNRLVRSSITLVETFFNPGASSQLIVADVDPLAGIGVGVSIVFRRQSAFNWWEFFYTGTGWQLNKVISAVDIPIGSEVPGRAGTVSVSITGNFIVATGPDGTQVSTTDAQFSAATGIGLILRGDGSSVSAVDSLTTYRRMTGSMKRDVWRNLSTSATGNASLLRTVVRTLLALATGGAVMKRDVWRNLSTSTTGNASLSRNVLRTMIVAATGTATSARNVWRVLSGTITGQPSIVRLISYTLATIVQPLGAISRNVWRTQTANVTGTGTLNRNVNRLHAVSTTGNASLTRSVYLNWIATTIGQSFIIRQITRQLIGIIAPVGSMMRDVHRSYSTTTTGVGTVARTLFQLFAAAASGVGYTSRNVNRNISITASINASIQRRINLNFSTTATGSPMMERLLVYTLAAMTTAVASMRRIVGRVSSTQTTGTATFTRNVALVHTATATGNPTFTRNFARILATTIPVIVTITRQVQLKFFAVVIVVNGGFEWRRNYIRILSAVTGPASATFRRAVWRSFVTTTTGAAAMLRSPRYQLGTGTTTVTASQVRQINRPFTAITNPAQASMARTVARIMTATVSGAGTFIRMIGRAQLALTTGAPTVTRTVIRFCVAVATGTPMMIRTVGRRFIAVAVGQSTQSRTIHFIQQATATGTGQVLRTLFRTLTGTITVAAFQQRDLHRTLAANATGNASIMRKVTREFIAVAAGLPSTARGVFRVLSVTATGVASILRNPRLFFTASTTGDAAMVRQVNRNLAGTTGSTVPYISILRQFVHHAIATGVSTSNRNVARTLFRTVIVKPFLSALNPFINPNVETMLRLMSPHTVLKILTPDAETMLKLVSPRAALRILSPSTVLSVIKNRARKNQ